MPTHRMAVSHSYLNLELYFSCSSQQHYGYLKWIYICGARWTVWFSIINVSACKICFYSCQILRILFTVSLNDFSLVRFFLISIAFEDNVTCFPCSDPETKKCYNHVFFIFTCTSALPLTSQNTIDNGIFPAFLISTHKRCRISITSFFQIDLPHRNFECKPTMFKRENVDRYK